MANETGSSLKVSASYHVPTNQRLFKSSLCALCLGSEWKQKQYGFGVITPYREVRMHCKVQMTKIGMLGPFCNISG